MATPATFQKAEDEFFLLRGKLQAGRITREQFDLAVKGLTIQDDQGRYWTIGGNTGKWYVHDGRAWVEATPPGTAGAPEPLPPPPAIAKMKRSTPLALIGLGLVVVLGLCGGIVLLFASSQGLLRISLGSSTNTPAPALAPPTLRAPVAPVVVVAVSTPSASPTLAAAPATTPPTAAPSSTPAGTAALTPTPTVLPAMTLTRAPVTLTAAPVVPTATLWPGLFVGGIKIDPTEPKDRQAPTFKVTFLNTLGLTVQSRWFVKIFRPEQRQSFGETAKVNSDIPSGTTELVSIANWKGVAGEPCNAYSARVFYEAPDGTILEFLKPGGGMLSFNFAVCR